MNPRDWIPPAAAASLRRLAELRDVKVGLPITSHRKAPIGPILIAAKKAFRILCQPFINELLRKQVIFNEESLNWAKAVHQELAGIETGTAGMRTAFDLRLRRLEDAIARMERLRASEPARPTTPTSVTAVNN
jgi:hypothetical protein